MFNLCHNTTVKKYAYLLLFAAVPLICVSVAKSIYEAKYVSAKEFQVFEQPMTDIPISTVNPLEQTVQLQAGAYILMDVDSGVVLAEKNADSLFFPASTTKMMTALIAREQQQLNTVIPVPLSAQNSGDRNFLPVGSHFTVEDLLKASLIQSNNSAAMTLATADPQGSAHFVTEMNRKATELHLTKTRFDNPVGFDGEYMQASARDLALLAKELIKDPFLKNIVNTKNELIYDAVTKKSYQLTNTNILLGYNNQVTGIKTGTTDMARQVLITLVNVNGHEVIIVLLESEDRYTDTTALVTWLNTQTQWFKPEDLIVTRP